MQAKRALPSLTKRIDLNVGYSCNLKCRFCYYARDVKAPGCRRDLTTEECKTLMRAHRRWGMEVLDFTGGEPTVRPDLFSLVRYAKDIGFRQVSVISNGVLLADRTYARELTEAGVDDFLLSLHGSAAAVHDDVTAVPGSYRKLVQAIENLLALPVRVRCNSVVTGAGLDDVMARAKLFEALGVKTVNFIVFNPLEQADCAEPGNFVRYADAAERFKAVIGACAGSFTKLTIRYMPLCVMQGYERYIENVHQVHYDHDEWDYYRRAFVREPWWKWAGGVVAGALFLPAKGEWAARGREQLLHAAILEAHTILHKVRPQQCRSCRYGFICGGVWRKYAGQFGTAELRAVPGPLLTDPWHFMDAAHRGQV